MKLAELTPAWRYYGALEGRWRGALTLRLKGWRALAGLPFGARARLLAVRLLGRVVMATTLAAEGRGYRHTTRVTKWGVRLFETEELISIGEDGRRLTMGGTQRATLGRGSEYLAEGEIDEPGVRATYRLAWLGLALVQRTEIVPAGLLLTQETAASRAEVLLCREAGTAG